MPATVRRCRALCATALKETMQPAAIVPFTAQTTCADPHGTRLVVNDRPGERLEQLRFAPGLLSAAFEAALRERVAQLAQFRHPCYARGTHRSLFA